MTRPARRPPAPTLPARHQSGAALVISLVLLMVLTVLAISTLRTSSLELLMAGNAQYRENAFQLAQTGIEAALRGGDPVTTADCAAPDVEGPVAVAALGGRYQNEICYRGESFSPGSSIPVTTFNFEVAAEGRTDQRDARVRLVQGFAVTGASGR